MPNTNANVYLALGINEQNQVFGVDPNNNIHLLSEENFAQVIAISGNGVIWAITTDPLSGSTQLSWSLGDGKWTVAINDSEAVLVCGANFDGAIFYTQDGTIWAIQTNNNSANPMVKIPGVVALEYGNSYIWIVAPIAPDTPACLQFTYGGQTPYKWQPFAGNVEPSSISVNYEGDCYAVQDFSPVYYSRDGSTTSSAGVGANGSALEITFKNTYYLLSTNANKNGNEVMVWKDTAGGTFVSAGFQAIQVLGTYYLPGS